MPSKAEVRGAIAALAAARAPRTICPSEVARALSEDWRPLMPLVREVAGEMQSEGALRVSQGGAPADPVAAKGPIRLAAR